MKVCKEEEEAIKVDVHEGCGRIKLFWLLALVDSNTFKGVVEFRENSRLTGTYSRSGIANEMCRFCGRTNTKFTEDGICFDDECQVLSDIKIYLNSMILARYLFLSFIEQQLAANACSKVHACGHICGGIKDEETCLPCLQGCSASNFALKQDADDMCMICFTEALSAAPSIQVNPISAIILFTSISILIIFPLGIYSSIAVTYFIITAARVSYSSAGRAHELPSISSNVLFAKYVSL